LDPIAKVRALARDLGHRRLAVVVLDLALRDPISTEMIALAYGRRTAVAKVAAFQALEILYLGLKCPVERSVSTGAA
jgi:hypothetical protein